jgi:hypothetical protein
LHRTIGWTATVSAASSRSAAPEYIARAHESPHDEQSDGPDDDADDDGSHVRCVGMCFNFNCSYIANGLRLLTGMNQMGGFMAPGMGTLKIFFLCLCL